MAVSNSIGSNVFDILVGLALPWFVETAIVSWKKHNPNFEIKLWTDKDAQDFVWSSPRSKKFFETTKNWAEKSDILRFEILYQFGGI